MSKIKEIDTGKVRLLAVIVPEGATEFDLLNALENPQLRTIHPNNGGWWYSENLPDGKWQILGLSTELTEEQWKDILPRYDGCRYKDYLLWMVNSYFYTAKESGLSLLEANQCYSVNTYMFPGCKCDFGDSKETFDKCLNDNKQWQQAQENTGKWLILKQL